MGIFSRTRDIIAANFNDLLEKADDPAKMIRMIIMEMEETLVEVRASAARTIADQKEMGRAVRPRRSSIGSRPSWADKAQLALSKGREDLARLPRWLRKQRRRASPIWAPSCAAKSPQLDDAPDGLTRIDIRKAARTRLREARQPPELP